MRAFIKKTIDPPKRKYNREIERNILTFGICLVVATVMWFLNILNKEYTTKITYPVKYADLPKGKLLVSELPEEITLEIKAHGFALLRYRIGTSFLPIVFNVNAYTNEAIEKKDLLDYTIYLSEIKDKISSQLNNDLNLINIEPKSIHFKFSKLQSKTVRVIPQVNYSLRRQHILKNPISVSPDRVMISGPDSVLDTIYAVYTRPLDLKDLSRNVNRTVSILPVPGIQPDIEEVKIQIEVERFTEARKNVPLRVKNLPESFLLQLFPGSVDVTYEVGLSRYDQVTDTSFIFTVDYDQIPHSPDFLPVHVEKCPDFIQNLSCSPGKVEYLVEKK